MVSLFWLAFFIFLVPVGSLLGIALSSARHSGQPLNAELGNSLRFAVAIPAHNEENVIGNTVANLQHLHYPSNLFDIHIIADHCTDKTITLARQAGAIVHERNDGPRTGKGAALSWLFKRILADNLYDAVLIFDADTQVDPSFMRVMAARLTWGEQVVQGQHIISNPEEGWFPALTAAMFLVDNRFQNLGRSNLGWSAKNMGDSICFRADVLRRIGWGAGLTEDYHLRQRLLLEGIKIAYDPRAKGYGEAPLTWHQAQPQRSRWLRGTRDASHKFARRLLIEGIKRRDGALLDGALQAYFPSYSTLTLIAIGFLTFQLLVNWAIQQLFPSVLIAVWAIVVGLLFIYPLLGLALEGASLRAYLAILSGPFYILWRTWLAFSSRISGKQIPWIRTAHGGQR
jgi:cellulose synthase/poly-beta-1,6-N-acetylglucosamine synthase-like glycosyltransferase